jgi:chaperone BCS1
MGRSVTFSGLLNALDGVRSQEGRILMMTTNHREKLDPALLRPGRADVHVELNYASVKQMKGLFKKFFPDSTD